jgi:hypothetical protein
MRAVVRIALLLLALGSISACVIDDGHDGHWRGGEHYDHYR